MLVTDFQLQGQVLKIKQEEVGFSPFYPACSPLPPAACPLLLRTLQSFRRNPSTLLLCASGSPDTHKGAGAPHSQREKDLNLTVMLRSLPQRGAAFLWIG